MANPQRGAYIPPANPSPQVQRVLRWAETFSSFERNVGSHFADDVEYHVLPRALQRPVVTRRRVCEEGFEEQRSLFNVSEFKVRTIRTSDSHEFRSLSFMT